MQSTLCLISYSHLGFSRSDINNFLPICSNGICTMEVLLLDQNMLCEPTGLLNSWVSPFLLWLPLHILRIYRWIVPSWIWCNFWLKISEICGIILWWVPSVCRHSSSMWTSLFCGCEGQLLSQSHKCIAIEQLGVHCIYHVLINSSSAKDALYFLNDFTKY